MRVDFGEEKKVESITSRQIDSIDFDSFDVIVLSDYDKGFLTKESVSKILLRCSGKKVFVDSKKRNLSCYEECIIKINKKEKSALEEVPDSCKLITTLGPAGATYAGEIFSTKEVEVSDVCGAGDTFLSALAVGFFITDDLPRAIRFANLCSSITVQRLGTYSIQEGDICDLCI